MAKRRKTLKRITRTAVRTGFLDLSVSNVGGKLERFPKKINRMLKNARITGLNLNGQRNLRLKTILRLCPGLRELHLEQLKLKSVPKPVIMCRGLIYLSLAGNKIRRLRRGCRKLSRLLVLDMRSNPICSEAELAVPARVFLILLQDIRSEGSGLAGAQSTRL